MGFFGRLFGGSKERAMEGEGSDESSMPGESESPEMTDGEEASEPEDMPQE